MSKIPVFSQTPGRDRHWGVEILKATPHLRPLLEDADRVVFVDATTSLDSSGKPTDAWMQWFLDLDLKSNTGRAVFVLAPESSAPHAWSELRSQGQIDDVITTPIRRVELEGRVASLERFALWNEVQEMNQTLSQTLVQMQDAVRIAERLQKARLPRKFDSVRGLEIHQRYLAGMKSGGDTMEVAESRDSKRVSFFISDSSTYGLSSAVLGAIVRATAQVAAQGAGGRESQDSCAEVLLRVQTELAATLGPKDALSALYASYDKSTLTFSYSHFGSVRLFHRNSRPEYGWSELSTTCPELKAGQLLRREQLSDHQIQLGAGDQLLMVTDGFGELGLTEKLTRLHDEKVDSEGLLNELAFETKSKRPSRDELPEQDCTALLITVPAQVLRLARGETGTSGSF